MFAQRGIVAATIDYRLADVNDASTHWPAQLEDAQLAARWMRQHAGELGFDPKRLCVYGESAGGHLAVWLGIADQALACVIDAFGPIKFEDLASDARYRNSLNALLGKGYSIADEKAAAPLSSIGPSYPPTLIIQGEKDALVDPSQSSALFDVLRKNNVYSLMIMYPGGHSWQNISPSTVSSILDHAVLFINSALPR